jgi:hypothetical protein
MSAPPDPKMRSPRSAATESEAGRNLEVQPCKNATAVRQAQHLKRLFALSLTLATAVAELAYAGGPR